MRYFLNIFIYLILFEHCNTYAQVNKEIQIKEQQRLVLIGAGGKKGKEYFRLLKNYVKFVAFVQPNPRPDLINIANQEKIKIYSDLDSLLNSETFDGALIVVPHYLHFNYTKKLLNYGKFVIKEKPIALNNEEINLYNEDFFNRPNFFTIVQRQFQQIYIQAKKELKQIGKIYSFKYEYNLGLQTDTQGWRTQYDLCGGGVVLDMGYHVIDILNTFFGMPLSINAQFAYKNVIMKKNNLEDEAFFLMKYPEFVGVVLISRYGVEKYEKFEISGENGIITITPHEYSLYNNEKKLIKKYFSPYTKDEELLNMFNMYFDHLADKVYAAKEFIRHSQNIKIIEDIYHFKNENYNSKI